MDTAFRIYCGAQSPQGLVSDDAFAQYLRDDVSPVFPGFTVTEGTGYWKGVPEPSRIVEVIGEHADRAAVDDLASLYCERFMQEAVLVTEAPLAAVTFATARSLAA